MTAVADVQAGTVRATVEIAASPETVFRALTDPGELARWFQWPHGRDQQAGIIRHAPGHRDHVHVRFACAAHDRECAPDRRGTELP